MKPEHRKILISHLGRQHSHQAAMALQEVGMLAGYWSGIPSRPRHRRFVPAPMWNLAIRYDDVPLRDELVRWLPLAAVIRRAASGVLRPQAAAYVDYAACRLFDLRVARLLRQTDAGAVIACETCAMQTFRVAKALGLTTILDAPSLHYKTQDTLHGYVESASLHRRVTAIKETEIQLADHVITVSRLAAETYLAAGVAEAKVHSVMLGADLVRFRPVEDSALGKSGVFRFVFVGATSIRKGFDLLMEAYGQVTQGRGDVELKVIGPRAGAWDASIMGSLPGAKVLPRLSQSDLAREMALADCMVLPSRNDSYGMVVAESLACGVPVIVSDMVGAKELIINGHNGWIVRSGDISELVERMRWCIEHRQEMTAMKEAARISAKEATWEVYKAQFAELVAGLIE